MARAGKGCGPLFADDGTHSVTDVSGITGQNRAYVLVWIVYYAWCIVFATWWASPGVEGPFGADMRNVIHVSDLCCSALVIFLAKKEQFVPLARAGAVLALVSGCAAALLPATLLRAFCGVGVGAGLACVNVAVLIPFVFILNNTEKFYAVLGSQALISASQLLLECIAVPRSVILPVSGVLLAAVFAGLLFFRRRHLPQADGDLLFQLPDVRAKLVVTVVAYCLLGLVYMGVGASLLRLAVAAQALPVAAVFHAGGLLGCVALYFIFARYRRSVYLAWCVPFACLAFGLMCYFFSSQMPVLSLAFALLLGAGSMMGMADLYYMMGVIGKKYNSMNFLRLNIIVIGLVSGVGSVLLGTFICEATAPAVSAVASMVSLVGIVAMMLLYPAFAGMFYDEDWVVDTEHTDVRRELADTLREYGLSKREIEACMLLLDGLTMRQIAPEMGISFYTVNTYTSSIYRKLGINSRTELLVMFGGAVRANGKKKPVDVQFQEKGK